MRIARGALATVLGGALAIGATVAGPAGAAVAAPGPGPGVVRWAPPLGAGDAVGVEMVRGGVGLSPDRRAVEAALDVDGHGDARSPGLLTLPAQRMARPVDRVEATVDLTDGQAGAGVTVDVRGRRASGGWTEWVAAEDAVRGPGDTSRRTATAVLPAPATEVQARLALSPVRTRWAGVRGPEVRALALAAYPATRTSWTQARRESERFRVFATREGLVGGKTANGHIITDRDLFVALPSRRALSPRDTSDYSVKVCAVSGRCAYAPVWDVGPWNTRDDYWNASNRRQSWTDLPQGVPQAQAAKAQGHNGGKDQFGRAVKNPAGIDLADGLFWDALGLRGNAWVTVDYLWTGDSPLGQVRVDRRVDLRSAPNPAARIVGLVANGAAVPMQCVTGSWLKIAAGQFVPNTAVPRGQWGRLPACTG